MDGDLSDGFVVTHNQFMCRLVAVSFGVWLG